MPANRQKYLYERLGDHDFQQLVRELPLATFKDFADYEQHEGLDLVR